MKKLMMLVLCLCVVGMAQAALLETDFDGAIPGAGSELTNVTWIADAAITASSTVTSVGGYELSNIAPTGATPSEWTDNVGVNHNLNTDRPAARGIVASFSVTGALDLGELVIGHTQTSNVGSLQAFVSDMTVTLTNVTDSLDLFTDTTNYDYSVTGWKSSAYDLSGYSLEAGKDYTITVTMQDMVGGGAYAAWNQISLSEVPEPATMVLLGLGSLLLRRKR